MTQSNHLSKDICFSRLESAVLHLVRGVIGRYRYYNNKESSIFATHIYSLLNLLQELHRFKKRRTEIFSRGNREFQHDILDLHREQLISNIVFSIQVIVKQLENIPFCDYTHRSNIVESLKRIGEHYYITEDKTSEVLPDPTIALKQDNSHTTATVDHGFKQDEVEQNYDIHTSDNDRTLDNGHIYDNVDHLNKAKETNTFTVSAGIKPKHRHPKAPSKALKKPSYTGFIKARVGSLVYDRKV